MQDSLGFWIPRFEFRIPGTRFQSLVGLRIDWQVFRISKPTIPDSTSKIVLDAGTNQKFPGVRNLDSLTWGEDGDQCGTFWEFLLSGLKDPCTARIRSCHIHKTKLKKIEGKLFFFIEKQSYQFVVSYTYFYFQFFDHCSITDDNEIFISSVECNAHILFQIYGTLNQRNHFASYTWLWWINKDNDEKIQTDKTYFELNNLMSIWSKNLCLLLTYYHYLLQYFGDFHKCSLF